MALLADGCHMGTHAFALSIAFLLISLLIKFKIAKIVNLFQVKFQLLLATQAHYSC